MTDLTLEPHIKDLERLFRMANPDTQTELRKDVERLIEKLKLQQHQPHQLLDRLQRLLADEADVDPFENMPV